MMSSSSRVRRRALTLLASTAMFTSLAVSCGGGDPSGPAGKTEAAGLKKREPTRVRVASVERREMVRLLSTTTVVESEKEVRIFPRATGVVTAIKVEEGDAVAEGAVLAELDARDKEAQLEEAHVAVREAEDAIKKAAIVEREAQSKVESARLALEQAQRDLDRNEKANLISQSALDGMRLTRDTRQADHAASLLALERSQAESKSAVTSLEKSRLALKSRELEHSYTRITAPFAGVIAQRSIKVGDSVGPGANAFVLTDALNLRATLHRPQRELSMFANALERRGDAGSAPLEIRATAEALPDARFHGELVRVSPSIDPASGSFRVTVKLDHTPEGNADGARLLPGMLVRVEIVTDRHPQALVVPKRALRREGEMTMLFLASNGVARRVEVGEGYTDDTSVEVISHDGAVAVGAQVIVVGNRELEDGGEIELEDAPANEPAKPAQTPAQAPAKEAAAAPEKG